MLLQLEAWRLARTIEGVTEEVFTTEREVVRNELRQRWETTIGNRLFDHVLKALYPPGHPLSRPVVGTHESLTAATLDHARAFVKEHYRPENCTIVIGGDVDTEEVKKLLGQWPAEILFGPAGETGPAVLPRARLSERKVTEVPPPRSRRCSGTGDRSSSRSSCWPGRCRRPTGARTRCMQFAATRLNLALGELDVREDDDIEGAGAFPLLLADSSVMILSAVLKPGADPDKARRRLLDVLVHAWSTDLGRLQTEASRWGSATELFLSAADPVGKAVSLAEYLGATGETHYFQKNFQELGAIKTGAVTDFAFKWLTRDRAVAVYFEPENDEIPRVLGGGGGGSGSSAGGAVRSHNVGRDSTAALQELSDEKLRQIVRSPELGKVPHFKLANGLQVFSIARPGAPVAQIQLGLRGGNATTQPVGAASLAVALARPKCIEAGSLDPVGGRIGTGTGLTQSVSAVSVLSGNLANGIAVLADRVRCREVDDESFLYLPRSLEAASKVFKRSEKRPEFIAGRKFYKELYPGHPFGDANFADPGALKNMRREDAQAFVQSHFRPENGAAVVYGDIDPADVKTLSEKYLNRWSGGAGTGSMMPPPVPAGPTSRKIILVDRPKATQATITLGCRLVPAVPEKLPAYDVLRTVAGEQAWALREQWGATYGIGAQVANLPGGGSHLVMSGAVENAQLGKSIARLLEVIGELAGGGVSERLFLTSRWDAGRAFMGRFATADDQASAILAAVNQGWPLDVWDKYPENLASTTRDSLKEILAPCLGKEIVAIVGDANVLRPQLEKEGLRLEGN